MHTVLLERGWFRRIFFQIICRLGIFLLFWRYFWTLIFFCCCSTRQNLVFYIFGQISFFFSTRLMKRVFNFRQIFEWKSYIQLIIESAYIREYMVFVLDHIIPPLWDTVPLFFPPLWKWPNLNFLFPLKSHGSPQSGEGCTQMEWVIYIWGVLCTLLVGSPIVWRPLHLPS